MKLWKRWFLGAGFVAAGFACGNASDEDSQACLQMCKTIVNGGCRFTSLSDCTKTCDQEWKDCSRWQEGKDCILPKSSLKCESSPSLCADELKDLKLCEEKLVSSDSGTSSQIIQCEPMSQIPPCECNGDKGSAKLCPPSGWTVACPC